MAHAGFDRAAKPADAVLADLFARSNIGWLTQYLAPAPSHHDASWMGQYAALKAAGRGVAHVYVGRQISGPGDHDVNAAMGALDGHDAAALMRREGCEPGRFVFLDLENPEMTPAVMAYVKACCGNLVANGYGAGVYCSHVEAAGIAALIPGVRIWAFRVATTAPHAVDGTTFPNADPAGSGYPAAHIWQCVDEARLTAFGGLACDLDTALTRDPSAPA